MKSYGDVLKKKYKCKITYVDYNKSLSKVMAKYRNSEVNIYDAEDHYVMLDIKKICRLKKIRLNIKNNLGYLNTPEDLNKYLKNKKGKNYNFRSFYIWSRKYHDILMMKNGKPIKGKYVFDSENRKPFVKSNIPKDKIKVINNKYVKEAKRYIKKNFGSNPGEDKYYYIPTNHVSAKLWLNNFIKKRLRLFGPYEDAVNSSVIYGYHSLLSPLTNIGLLTPRNIIYAVLKYVRGKSIPINSLEGFIRQLIGWREYCRLIYRYDRVRLSSGNYFNNKKKLNKNLWYYKKVGSELKAAKSVRSKKNNLTRNSNSNSKSIKNVKNNLTRNSKSAKNKKNNLTCNSKSNSKSNLNSNLTCNLKSNSKAAKTLTSNFKFIDDMLDKVMKYGYLHHIERLMYVGNYLLLTGVKPKDVFDWYQSMFMDSYHVFMYPNVYGMSQYSCGNLMMTRPYLASSNYMKKMSNYFKDKENPIDNKEAAELFDAIYYNFIRLNKLKLAKNYSTAPQVKHWNNKTKKQQQEIIREANNYLKKY